MNYYDIVKTNMKLVQFAEAQKNGQLELSPFFQRRPVWKKEAKSFLIDSIVRGLPVPLILLREKQIDLSQMNLIREVVDGQQRLRTVLSFVAPYLLKDFTENDEFNVLEVHNKEVSGKSFANLPHDIKSRILNYQFSVHVLPPQIDDREVLQLFARLNSTGFKLNSQELRNAQYHGDFKTFVYELAFEQFQRWIEWGVFSKQACAEMDEVELTSEIVMLMIDGIQQKEQSRIDDFYKMYDPSFQHGDELARRFRLVMDTIDAKLGVQMKNLAYRRKGFIYALIASFYDLMFGIGSELNKVGAKSIDEKNRLV